MKQIGPKTWPLIENLAGATVMAILLIAIVTFVIVSAVKEPAAFDLDNPELGLEGMAYFFFSVLVMGIGSVQGWIIAIRAVRKIELHADRLTLLYWPGRAVDMDLKSLIGYRACLWNLTDNHGIALYLIDGSRHEIMEKSVGDLSTLSELLTHSKVAYLGEECIWFPYRRRHKMSP